MGSEAREKEESRLYLRICNFLWYLTASVSEEWYSRMIPVWPRDSCVDPAGDDLGGDEAGVRYNGALVIISKNESSWRSDNALCKVSRGLMGGTPPKPSIAMVKNKNYFYVPLYLAYLFLLFYFIIHTKFFTIIYLWIELCILKSCFE